MHREVAVLDSQPHWAMTLVMAALVVGSTIYGVFALSNTAPSLMPVPVVSDPSLGDGGIAPADTPRVATVAVATTTAVTTTIAAIAATTQLDDGWFVETSTDGKFRAEFPVEPKRLREAALPGADSPRSDFVASRSDGTIFAVVSTTEDLGDEPESKLFDEKVRASVQELGGDLQTDKDIRLDRTNWREFTIDSGGGVATNRMTYREGRLYLLTVFVPTSVGDRNLAMADFDRMTSSFESL